MTDSTLPKSVTFLITHSFMMMGIEIGSNSARMPLVVMIEPKGRLLSAMLKGPNGNAVAQLIFGLQN
jgi:hypothetical protein